MSGCFSEHSVEICPQDTSLHVSHAERVIYRSVISQVRIFRDLIRANDGPLTETDKHIRLPVYVSVTQTSVQWRKPAMNSEGGRSVRKTSGSMPKQLHFYTQSPIFLALM